MCVFLDRSIVLPPFGNWIMDVIFWSYLSLTRQTHSIYSFTLVTLSWRWSTYLVWHWYIYIKINKLFYSCKGCWMLNKLNLKHLWQRSRFVSVEIFQNKNCQTYEVKLITVTNYTDVEHTFIMWTAFTLFKCGYIPKVLLHVDGKIRIRIL